MLEPTRVVVWEIWRDLLMEYRGKWLILTEYIGKKWWFGLSEERFRWSTEVSSGLGNLESAVAWAIMSVFDGVRLLGQSGVFLMECRGKRLLGQSGECF